MFKKATPEVISLLTIDTQTWAQFAVDLCRDFPIYLVSNHSFLRIHAIKENIFLVFVYMSIVMYIYNDAYEGSSFQIKLVSLLLLDNCRRSFRTFGPHQYSMNFIQLFYLI